MYLDLPPQSQISFHLCWLWAGNVRMGSPLITPQVSRFTLGTSHAIRVVITYIDLADLTIVLKIRSGVLLLYGGTCGLVSDPRETIAQVIWVVTTMPQSLEQGLDMELALDSHRRSIHYLDSLLGFRKIDPQHGHAWKHSRQEPGPSRVSMGVSVWRSTAHGSATNIDC